MRAILMSLIFAAAGLAAVAQEMMREEIRRSKVPGTDEMEVVVSRLIVPPGATIPLHTHPGDEHAVVVTPSMARTPNGTVVEFAVGTPLYFPQGEVHGGLTNIGEADMVAITTQIVRVDAPLTVPAE